MEFNAKEMTVIYNFDERGSREALTYAKQIAQNVNEIDISRQPLTRTQLAELLNKINIRVEEIVDKKSDLYHEKYQGVEMSEDDWLEVLVHNPILIKTPIGILGDKAVVCDLPNQMLELDTGQGYDENLRT